MRFALAQILLITTFSIAAVVVEPNATATTGPAPSVSADDGLVSPVQAAALAVEQDQPVEITALRSETETVYANPSGTQTLEASAVPVRTRDQDGSWVDIDTTLRRNDDGTVAPVASDLDMTFSGGGDGPFVKLESEGADLSLTWPGELPAPTLADNTATYAEILPGVDLVLRAEPDTFAHVLVVKNATAAANPAIRELRLGLDAPGMSVRSDSGRLTVTDPRTGITEFEAPGAIMWDSSGDGAATERRHAPLDGDRVDEMGVSATQDRVTLRPSTTVLSDPATVYPVYLDPTINTGKTYWAMVSKRNPDTAFSKWSNTPDYRGEGVGYTADDGSTVKRLFWNFPTSRLNGSRIIKATFTAWQRWAYSCTPSRVDLYRTGLANSGTTWDHQPWWADLVSSRSVASGRTECDFDGGDVDFSAGEAAKHAADNNLSSIGLGLRAYSESDPNGWKRFYNNARFVVEYNHAPKTPGTLRTDEPYTLCNSGSDRPVIAKDAPKVSTKVSDPNAGDHVRVRFEYWTGTASERPTNGGSIRTTDYRAPADADGDFLPYRMQLPDVFAAGGVFTWRAIAQDNLGDWGPWSKACEFRVDVTKPSAPTIVPSGSNDYKTGNRVSFTIDSTSTDVVKYKWSHTKDGLGTVAPGGSVTVSVDLATMGPDAIYAQSVDAAGNLSATAIRDFKVSGGAPAARFAVDEMAGATTVDETDVNRWLSFGTGAEWSERGWIQDDQGNPTKRDGALAFAGTGSAASNVTMIVPGDTGYGVSAHLRPTESTTGGTAVSQDGPGGSTFTLGTKSGCVEQEGVMVPCYSFAVTDASGAIASVDSDVPVDWEEWTYVLGVYEPVSRDLSLHVAPRNECGGLPSIGGLPSGFVPPASTDTFRLGRATVPGGSATRYFKGAVDDVHVIKGVLSQAQVNTDCGEVQPR